MRDAQTTTLYIYAMRGTRSKSERVAWDTLVSTNVMCRLRNYEHNSFPPSFLSLFPSICIETQISRHWEGDDCN